MKKWPIGIGLILLCGLILYWKMSGGDSAKPALQTDFEQNDIRISIRTTSEEIRHMKEARFTITLRDTAGNPLTASEIDMTYVMPQMFCGVFHAEIALLHAGTYLATGIPVMKGNWEATITVIIGKNTISMKHPFQSL